MFDTFDTIVARFKYYVWSSYGRKIIDTLHIKYAYLYRGIVLDIGGRDRGRFKKPKDKVEKWIFADINEDYHPDVVLDVANMPNIESNSIDVISAINLFCNVERMEDGLKESYRVLKPGGNALISVPFMHAVAEDPVDFQRWGEKKWKKFLTEIGFTVEKIEIEGLFFTVMADMTKDFIKSLPAILKYPGYFTFPILDFFVYLDTTSFVKDNPRRNKYHQGYFIIVRK